MAKSNNPHNLICNDCKQDLPKMMFHRRSTAHNDGYSYYCKTCTNTRRRQWREDNPGKDSAAARRSNYKRYYGITVEEYEEMASDQGNECAICHIDVRNLPDIENRSRKEFDVDHDHETGKVRGLLCHNCNKGLGNFKDSVENLQAAIRYLLDRN